MDGSGSAPHVLATQCMLRDGTPKLTKGGTRDELYSHPATMATGLGHWLDSGHQADRAGLGGMKVQLYPGDL